MLSEQAVTSSLQIFLTLQNTTRACLVVIMQILKEEQDQELGPEVQLKEGSLDQKAENQDLGLKVGSLEIPDRNLSLEGGQGLLISLGQDIPFLQSGQEPGLQFHQSDQEPDLQEEQGQDLQEEDIADLEAVQQEEAI